MKKILSVLALALCMLMLSACKITGVLSDIATQLHEANAAAESAENTETASAADAAEASVEESADEPEAPAEETAASATDTAPEPTPTEAPAETSAPEKTTVDLTALSLEELVVPAEGTDGMLPRITADCSGAAYINDDIDGTFGYMVGEDYVNVYYDAAKTGRILSIVIAENYDGDASYYTPYNLDLATGQYLTGEELLALLGADRTVIGDTEIAVMAEEFEHMYGTDPDADETGFQREQYDRTISTNNAEFDRVWLGVGGELYFAARIYSLAGAEFYEYPMSTGLYF